MVPQILCISGLPGSGTSSNCELLQTYLGWDYVNAGVVFRRLAGEAGLSLAEFGRLAEVDGRIDRDLDARMAETAKTGKQLILEGRLAGWTTMQCQLPVFRVWLKACRSVRAARLADRDVLSLGCAQAALCEREISEAKRYVDLYGFDISDLSIYDLLIDTGTMSVAESADLILAGLSAARSIRR